MINEHQLVGAVGFSTMSVRPGDTSVAIGVGDLPVLAPSLIQNAMQTASLASIAEFLDPGESTYESEIHIQMHSGVAIGGQVRTVASVTAFDGREIAFECQMHEGDRLVASAILKRVAVERVSFLARTAAQSITSAN